MVRTYKRKRDECTFTEDEMALAIADVINKKKSIRESAATYRIKTMTLQNRVLKFRKQIPEYRVEREEVDQAEIVETQAETVDAVFEVAPQVNKFQSKFTSQQVFTNCEEKMLAEYLLKSSAIQFGLTYKQAREFAYSYAMHLDLSLKIPKSWMDNKMAGIDWMKLFMKRHPALSLRKPENTSLSRATSFNKTNVNEFFDNFERTIGKYKLPAERIFNLDETGVTTVMQAPKVIAKAGAKQVGQAVSAERGELVTFCAIVNAIGNTIPPVFIFPRKRNKDAFLKGSPPGSLGLANPTGWMNGITFLETMKHVQKHTCCTKDSPILILLDNHESHASLDVILYCRDNGIVFVTFPPHCTHRLQPLDVGLYGPFKSHCKSAFNNWLATHPGQTISIYDIPELACKAYIAAFSMTNILSAFAKTGIWPLNRCIFTDDDFQSSYVTDRAPPISTELNPVVHSSPSQHESSLPSTSGTARITPESVRPYPKVQQPRQEGRKGRRKGKSRVLTETPEKNRVEEETKAREEKKRKVGEKNKPKQVAKKLFPQAKKRRTRYASSSTEDADDVTQYNSDDSLRECVTQNEDEVQDNSTALGRPPSPNMLTLKSGNYVVIKLTGKRSVKHYIGLVIEKISMDEYKINFMKKKDGFQNGFIWPENEDSSNITFEEIVGILDQPSIDRRGINNFDSDMSGYENLN